MAGTFKNPCNYSLWFSQDDFTVKPHLVDLTAWIDGPKQKANWNLDIANGYDRFISHIFRGAYRYHYGFIDGLNRPQQFFGGRTIYIAKDEAKNWQGINLIILPIIKITRYNQYNIEYNSDEIFSTTVHETSHNTHFMNLPAAISYLLVTAEIRESWATGVEWWLTKLEYKNTRGIANYGDWNYGIDVGFPNQFAYQYWELSDDSSYTSLFINLLDDYNEFNQSFLNKNSGTVNDQVSGYKLADLETKVLPNVYWLNNLAAHLKLNKPNGVTDAQIDELLSYY
jgi:hypothetical protein